jgi:eukaryotic-like serine/threonine-protein kinase
METPIREGEILAGKYRVDRVLGVGGMGVVAAAHHLELDDKVAIKFLLPETLGNAEAVARFAREARAAVKIKSEHVARVSDVGKLENGAPYMVMEYLEGMDLSGWLSKHGPLPLEQAAEFILQASEAIAEAHTLGIVHRDLKPANLFVIRRPDGALSIKVLDFGISKMTSLSGSGGEGSMTRTSTMMGSPIYMSPEQIQSSKDVDQRGDIWALGVILYELITGEPPFGGEHMAELIFSIISAAPPPMRARRPDVPPELERVILHCLEKQRSSRFPTVEEMAIALLPFAPKRSAVSVERISGVTTGRNPRGGLATVAINPAAPVNASTTGADRAVGAGTQASWGNTATTKKHAPLLWVGLAAAFVVAVGGGIALKLSHGGAQASANGSISAAPPAASPPTPALPLPEAPSQVTSAASPEPAAATIPPPPSAAAKSSAAAAVAGHPKPPPPSIKPKPSGKAPGNDDPWGGQH